MRFGRYTAIEKINVGGMAEIYKATTSDGKLFAIKRILPAYSQNKRFVELFIDEARVSLSLRHPNIIKVYDIGILEDNTYFLAMEYIEGKNLFELIRDLKSKGRTMPLDISLCITSSILDGLDYAHNVRDIYNRDLKIVHQDISPPNIMVSHTGEVKILDFGIAQCLNYENLYDIEEKIIKGKLGYMSPEQVSGKDVDIRTDIFSCGILLFEMLSMERLFYSEERDRVIKMIKKTKIPKLTKINSMVNQTLEKMVSKVLERKARKRFQTAKEFKSALLSQIDGLTQNVMRERIGAFMGSL